MFVGKAEHTVNKDGRLSIPSKMRDVISRKYNADDLYLVLMGNNLICLYPYEEFDKLTTALMANPEGRELQEIMEIERICANAEPCKLDGSGRIVIPPLMRQEAGIEDEVLVVGAMSHIEIWDKKYWEYSRRQAGSGMDKFKAFSGKI